MEGGYSCCHGYKSQLTLKFIHSLWVLFLHLSQCQGFSTSRNWAVVCEFCVNCRHIEILRVYAHFKEMFGDILSLKKIKKYILCHFFFNRNQSTANRLTISPALNARMTLEWLFKTQQLQLKCMGKNIQSNIRLVLTWNWFCIWNWLFSSTQGKNIVKTTNKREKHLN